MLSKLCETPQKWDRVLHLLEFALNNSICRATNQTPSRLLFGIDQLGTIDDKIRHILDPYSDDNRDLAQLREQASTNIVKLQNKNTRTYNDKHKAATNYKVGDYVVIKNTDVTLGVNKKLLPKYKGPYEVKTVLDFDRYIVSDVDGFQVTQKPFTTTVGPDQIKLWNRA